MPIPRIPDDYVPSGGEFKSFDSGKYEVVGLNFFSVNDEDEPIFKAPTGDRLVAYYRTILVDGSEGPPGSIDRGQIPLLVRAFGASPSELPPYEQPTKRLILAERLINSVDKKVKVNVGNSGWINWVTGADLQIGLYRFKFTGVVTRNQFGEPAWKAVTSRYGEGTWRRAYVAFRVVCGISGNPTPFDHVVHREPLTYALEVKEEGILDFERNDDGNWTSASVTMDKFLHAVCGEEIYDEEEGDWQDRENIMIEVHRIGREKAESGRCVGGLIEANRNGRMCLRLGNLQPVECDSRAVGQVGNLPELNLDEEDLDDDFVEPLYKLIEEMYVGDAFDEKGNVSASAIDWWKQISCVDPEDGVLVRGIVAFCRKHGIPRAFDQMTSNQVSAIMSWMGREVDGGDNF